MKILSFGEIIWDVYPDKRCVGGAPLNFAAHVSLSGQESYLLSAVGDDELGIEAKNVLKRLGVRTDYIRTVTGVETGRCIVTLDNEGVPSYDILPDTAYDNIAPDSTLFTSRFNAIAFGTLALRTQNNKDILCALINSGCYGTVFCDLNLRAPFFDEDTVRWCLEVSDALKLSECELEYVENAILHSGIEHESKNYSDTLRALSEKYKNLKTLILTCGEDGAYVYTDGKLYYKEAEKVKVISTVGAGESFGAVYLVNHLYKKSPMECLILATERSARVVECVDAVPMTGATFNMDRR